MKTKILVFAGSTRTGSFNKKLAKIAAHALEKAGANVTYIDLKDYPLPLYDGDLEEQHGLPEKAKALKSLFLANNAILISSPEYNSGPSAVLKNVIDWISRQESKDEPSLAAFQGKYAALISASPGAWGGLRGLVHVKMILGNIGVTVLPKQFCLAKAHEAFDKDNNLLDKNAQKSIEDIAKDLVDTVNKIRH